MDHHHGDQGGGGHEGMPMPGHDGGGDGEMMMCAMSMVWNASMDNVCVVFPSWRISGPYSMMISALLLAVMAAMLEHIRMRMRNLDAQILLSSSARGGAGAEGFMGPASARNRGSLGFGSASTMAAHGMGQHRRKASVKGIHHGSGDSGVISTASLGLGNGANGNSGASSRTGSDTDDGAPLLPGGRGPATATRRSTSRLASSWSSIANPTSLFAVQPLPVTQSTQLMRTLLFGMSLTLSMFLMLVFMTYNAYLIISVLLGYMAGYYLFNRDIGGPGQLYEEDKGMACH